MNKVISEEDLNDARREIKQGISGLNKTIYAEDTTNKLANHLKACKLCFEEAMCLLGLSKEEED